MYKSSFDKANRSSRDSFRGSGYRRGPADSGRGPLADSACRCLTDVHEDTPMAEVAAVVDVLQTPAFLCRQTNFMSARRGVQGKPVNIKKGQFLSPWEMQNVVDKARSTGNDRHHGVRTRFQLRLQQPRFGHAQPGGNARHRMPGRLRRDALGAAAREAKAARPVGSGSSSRCSRERRPPRALPACSWKRTRNPTRPCRTDPTPWPLASDARDLLKTMVATSTVR